ncbi:MAG TPA: GDSL-type esterase/lipase family protein [Pyrinomonadaceae bacterium]|jgi:lysophospholipase L1-like esterase
MRWTGAALSLITIPFLWWYLAAPGVADQIFGLYSMKIFAALVVATYLLLWAVYLFVSSETISGKTARLTLTSIALIFVFVALELPAVTGLLDYRKVISPPEGFLVTNLKPWDNPANLLDPELMHIHRANQKIAGETKGDLVKWLGISTERRYPVNLSYDRNGFRNEYEIEQAPVVLVGDSFVEGVLVPQNALVSSELKRQLNVEVANLGQSGYGPQQELAVVRRFASQLKPRLILWFFFEGNDLIDVPRYEEFIKNRDEIMKSRDSFANRSFTRNVLFTLAGLTAPKPAQDESEAHRRSGRFGSETLYFAYPGVPLTKTELESLKTAETSILQAHQLAKQQGSKLLLVHVPTKFRVYSNFCEFPDDGYGKTWKANDLPFRLGAWSKDHGVAYFDLTPALIKHAANGELVYFTDDGHWNAKGHQAVAAALADHVHTNGWLRSENKAGE